jgi:hypothetical protein
MKHTSTTEEGSTADHTDLNRRSLIMGVCMILLSFGLLISACDHPGVDPSQKTAPTENKKMKSALSNADARPEIPPLDLSQPREFKTATFAMG